MGKQEEHIRKRTKKNQLQKIVLQSVKTAGILSLAMLLPNVLGAMYKLGLIASPRQREVVRNTSDRLVRAGLLEWHKKDLRLTEKGERQLRLLTLDEYGTMRRRRWDGKWRVIIFDIPEKRGALRRKLKSILQEIGFVRLQDSVWVYPYECEDLAVLLKADLHVGDDIRYLIVDSIERDEALKSVFKLS